MKQLKYIFLFVSFIIVSCNSRSRNKSKSSSDTGKVVAIIDGDTYDILIEGNKTVRIRMEGIHRKKQFLDGEISPTKNHYTNDQIQNSEFPRLNKKEIITLIKM